MKPPNKTLMKHVMELRSLAERMEPGEAKKRIEARYEEAKRLLREKT